MFEQLFGLPYRFFGYRREPVPLCHIQHIHYTKLRAWRPGPGERYLQYALGGLGGIDCEQDFHKPPEGGTSSRVDLTAPVFQSVAQDKYWDYLAMLRMPRLRFSVCAS